MGIEDDVGLPLENSYSKMVNLAVQASILEMRKGSFIPESLHLELKGKHLETVDVAAGSNCFFHAMSHKIFGSADNYVQVKRGTMTQLRDNQVFQSSWNLSILIFNHVFAEIIKHTNIIFCVSVIISLKIQKLMRLLIMYIDS